MSALDRLEAADVIIRYAACIDERDFERYPSCFRDDVAFHGFASEPIRGIEAWVSFVERAIEPFTGTQHLLGPPAVTLDGDVAELRTDLQAKHFFREPAGRILTLWGTYHSSLTREDGAWRMRRHELVTRATRIGDPYRT